VLCARFIIRTIIILMAPTHRFDTPKYYFTGDKDHQFSQRQARFEGRRLADLRDHAGFLLIPKEARAARPLLGAPGRVRSGISNLLRKKYWKRALYHTVVVEIV
jgi:hypothetical protein